MPNDHFSFHLLQSRAALIISCVLVFVFAVAALCGGNTATCLSVIGTDGMVSLAWIFAAGALGSVVMHGCGIRARSGLFIATAGGLGLGIFSLLGLGLGLLGVLNRPVALAMPVGSIALWIGHHLRTCGGQQIDRPAIRRWLLQPAGSSWLWLIPIVSLAFAAVSASIMPGMLWKPLDPHPYDVTSYHLLVPREWYEGGRIVPLSHNVFSFFPFNVEMQFLLMMHAMGGPWAGMYACQFLCVGYSMLMVLAVFGEESPSARNGSAGIFRNGGRIIGAAIAAIVPWVIMLAGVAYVESALMLYTALAIAWAIRACGESNGFLRCMLISGVMTGLACGVKITAVPMLLLALPVGVGITLLVRRPPEFAVRRILIGCVLLLITGSIVLCPWLIRNFVWAGNPLFPLAMKTLGQNHLSNGQVERFITAHSPAKVDQDLVAKTLVIWNDVITHWQFGFVLLPAGVVAMARGVRDRQMWIVTIIGLFVAVTFVGFTHLQPRFFVMTIPISAIAIGRVRWGRPWPIACLILMGVAGISWSNVATQLCKQSNPMNDKGERTPAVLFGLEDLNFSDEMIDAAKRNLQVALIGDAQAFLYQIPMSHLHYRSVFNVATDTENPIDAWAGPQVRGNPNWLLVINPTEINRLHNTYVAIPALPREWATRGPDTIFITGDKISP